MAKKVGRFQDSETAIGITNGTEKVLRLNTDGQLPVLIYGSINPNEQIIGNKRALHMDANTHSLLTLDYNLHELNRGHIFLYTSYGQLAENGHKYFYIATPASPAESEYFFRWRVSGDDAWSLHIYGNTNPDDQGNVPFADGQVINKLIGSPNTTDLILKEDGSLGDSTSEILIARHWGGTGHKEGGIVDGDPFIIKAGISFWADIKNEGTGTSMYDWTFEWWEQTPKSIEPE